MPRPKPTPPAEQEKILKAGAANWKTLTEVANAYRCAMPTLEQKYLAPGLLKTAVVPAGLATPRFPTGTVVTTPDFVYFAMMIHEQQKAAAQRKDAQERRAELDAQRRRELWWPEGGKQE